MQAQGAWMQSDAALQNLPRLGQQTDRMCGPSNSRRIWCDRQKKAPNPHGQAAICQGFGLRESFSFRTLFRSDDFGTLKWILTKKENKKNIQLGVICTAGLRNAIFKQVVQLAGLKNPRRSMNKNNQILHIHGDLQPNISKC